MCRTPLAGDIVDPRSRVAAERWDLSSKRLEGSGIRTPSNRSACRSAYSQGAWGALK